jgi:hypothetical protein
MEITFDLGEADLLALNAHILKHSPTMRRQQFAVRWLFTAAFLVAGLLILLVAQTFDLPLVSVIGYAMIAAGVGFPFVFPTMFRTRVRSIAQKRIREGHNRGMFGRHHIEMTKGEITREAEFGHTAYSWSAVEKIELGDEHLFIFVNSFAAFVIPKRVFEDERSFEEFAETARHHFRQAADRVSQG